MQKYQHIFDTSHLQNNLKNRSLRSGAVTMGSQGVMFVLQLASTMVLARILSPADYGINGMAVAITGFAHMFSTLGLSTATVQKAEINHEQVSTLFWINVAIGCFLTLIVALISPLVAAFYGVPDLFLVILVLSVIFAINGLSVQHSALLRRQMLFLDVAKIQIVSSMIGLGTAIIFGLAGFRYWALVFNSLVTTVSMTCGYWLLCRWKPGVPKFSTEVKSMVKFGTDIVGFNVINYLSRNLDNVLIGKFYGASALGFYSKAYQLLMMPLTNLREPLVSVAIPALSRLQNEPDSFRAYYLKSLSMLSFITLPIVVFMFICSDELVLFFLGPKWGEVSMLFKILAAAALIQPLSGTVSMVLLSTGKSRLFLYIGLFSSICICISFVVGLPWGAEGVAMAYAIVNYVILLPVLYFSFKSTQIRLRDFFKAIARPVVVAFSMGFIYLSFIADLLVFGNIAYLISSLVFCVFLYFFLFLVFGGKKELKEYKEYVILILHRKTISV